MKLLNTWKFYVGIIVLGFAIWITASILLLSPEETLRRWHELNVIPQGPGSKGFAVIHPPKMIYGELKFWAENVGKILVGLGGTAGAIKTLLDLFRRKK